MFLHTVHPLFWIGLGVLAVGIFTSIREKNPRSRPVAWFFILAGVFLVIFTGRVLVFGPPADIAAVRNADASRVVAFELLPVLGQPSSCDLSHESIRVTDRAKIERLVALLNASTYASPNHPKGGWMTRLVLDDGRERHDAVVSSTSDGLLIRIGGSGVGHDFRNEEMKAFLEAVAKEKK